MFEATEKRQEGVFDRIDRIYGMGMPVDGNECRGVAYKQNAPPGLEVGEKQKAVSRRVAEDAERSGLAGCARIELKRLESYFI